MFVRGKVSFLYVDISLHVGKCKFITKNSSLKCLFVFLPIFVANTKIIFAFNFLDPSKVIKNTLPNKLGTPEYLKNNHNSWKPLLPMRINMSRICLGHSTSFFYSRFFVSSDQSKKNVLPRFYYRHLLETFLYENNCNHNFYKFLASLARSGSILENFAYVLNAWSLKAPWKDKGVYLEKCHRYDRRWRLAYQCFHKKV